MPHEIRMATVVIVLVNESQCYSITFFLVAIYKQVFVFECAELLFKVLDGEVSFDLLVNEVVNGVEALSVDDLDTFFVHHFHSRDQSRDVLHITVAFQGDIEEIHVDFFVQLGAATSLFHVKDLIDDEALAIVTDVKIVLEGRIKLEESITSLQD